MLTFFHHNLINFSLYYRNTFCSFAFPLIFMVTLIPSIKEFYFSLWNDSSARVYRVHIQICSWNLSSEIFFWFYFFISYFNITFPKLPFLTINNCHRAVASPANFTYRRLKIIHICLNSSMFFIHILFTLSIFKLLSILLAKLETTTSQF